MAKGDSTTRTQGAQTLLIVDDERSLRFSIGEWARDMGYTPLEAPGGREALEAVREHGADAVLLDLRLGDEDGLKLLRQIREADPDVPVVMLTGHGTVEHAVRAIKMGAYDFMLKPPDLDHLGVVLERAIEHARLRREVDHLRATAPSAQPILGASEALQRALGRLERAARGGTATVLLLRRDRLGQGTHRPLPPREEPARRGAVHRAQLQRDSRAAARERAVRPRARRVHRREAIQEGPVRTGRRRHAVPRRDRGDGAAAPGQAAARARDAHVPPRRRSRRHHGRRAGRRGDAPRPDQDGHRGPLSRGPVLPAQRRAGRRSRRCANASPTCRCSPSTSCSASAANSAGPPRASRRRRSRCSRRTPGPETCASCGTSSSGSCCSKPRRRSCPSTCPPRSRAARDRRDKLRRTRIPSRAAVVRPIADIEKMAIEHALRVCEGNKTRAAVQLGISRQTLRTKLKDYALGDDGEEGPEGA